MIRSRPRRPLPSRNGWIASNCSCTRAHWTSGGRPVRSCEEAVPLGESGMHLGDRRRHVDGGLERRTRRADPVLAATELPGRPAGVAHALQQPFVQLEDEPTGERQLGEAVDTVHERGDVVAHLAQVLAQREVGSRRDFVEEQVDERRRRALDARREDGLLAEERRDEYLRIAPPAGEAGELAQRGVGGRHRLHELAAVGQPGRQRGGHERLTAVLRGDQVACLGGLEIRRVHWLPPAGSRVCVRRQWSYHPHGTVTGRAGDRRRTRCDTARRRARRSRPGGRWTARGSSGRRRRTCRRGG